jgi:hypothetical protein
VIDLIRSLNPWVETALILGLLWIVYRVVNGSWRFWHLALGVDGRYSSSLFHGLCWTVVVLTSYLTLYLARVHAGSTDALGTIPPNVLTALGLSLGTTATAAGITSGAIARNPRHKSLAPVAERSFRTLVEDDEHNPNLPKAQLMVWTFVALGIYLVATVDAVSRTMATTNLALLPALPDIDTTLLVLSGIGQASYLATKAVAAPGPDAATREAAAAPTVPGSAGPGQSAASAVAAALAAQGPKAAASPASSPVVTALAGPASVRVPGFLPSVNGLHFINSFPHEADLSIDLPGVGSIPIGDASNGLCGGMAYTVRDVFQTQGLAPVATRDLPARGSPLFRYIVDRLMASFDLPNLGFMRYYEWMLTPDGNASWPPLLTRQGVAWKTIVEEWPARIRPELDAGRLCCLGLVTVAGTNPADLGRNHQVLAYGYDVDGAGGLTLRIYDPNTPPEGADDVAISLSLVHPEQPTPIHHNVAIDTPIRGFFRTDYAYRDPTGLLG